MGDDKLQIAIELDDATALYAAGGDVSGRIDLRNVDDRVRDVALYLEWRTTDARPQHGRTDAQHVNVAGLVLGGRARPAFKLKLPRAPVSYEGTLFSIWWMVVARVDVAWALDPVVEKRIEVVAPDLTRPTKPLTIQLGHARKPKKGVLRDHASSFFGASVGLLAPIAVALPFLHVAGLVVGGAVAVGGSAALFAMRRWSRDASLRAFGGPTIVLDPSEPRLGQSVKVRVALAPPGSLHRVRIVYRLVALEAMKVQHGRSIKTQTSNCVVTTGTIGDERPTATGACFIEGAVVIPKVNAPSFDAEDHAIYWQLELEISGADDRQNLVTLTDKIEITVLP